ncbi:hypothetical protein P3X46_005393 [Hevea brasiliensis]|uniref:Uncharacterized protein n=1 Tax=Hevea brasiliensis TaxID=3981 RepID=A0ABQ9N282_HEVBR|nr:hypothetical protein P3X46_005393 [Hevea brasiliensis]
MEARPYMLIIILLLGFVAALGPRTCHGSIYKTELAKMSLQKVAKADGFRRPPVTLIPPQLNSRRNQGGPPRAPPLRS